MRLTRTSPITITKGGGICHCSWLPNPHKTAPSIVRDSGTSNRLGGGTFGNRSEGIFQLRQRAKQAQHAGRHANPAHLLHYCDRLEEAQGRLRQNKGLDAEEGLQIELT